MSFTFKKATKEQARGRVALIGPSGSGKTFTALRVLSLMCKRIAVIDTERGSASKYADKFSFDVLELESFEPANYVAAIKAAGEAGYDGLVIDSLSHAWMGKGGALEMVNTAQTKQRTPNSYTAWRDVTPQHNALIDAMLGSSAHVFVTMRAKTEYVQEKDERGKTTIRKVGLAPVQRDGMEYEFDVVGDIDPDHNLIVSKTRCDGLDGKVFPKPGEEFAKILGSWLGSGAAPMAKAAHVEPEAEHTPIIHASNAIASYLDLIHEAADKDALTIIYKNAKSDKDITTEQLAAIVDASKVRVAALAQVAA